MCDPHLNISDKKQYFQYREIFYNAGVLFCILCIEKIHAIKLYISHLLFAIYSLLLLTCYIIIIIIIIMVIFKCYFSGELIALS